MELHFKGNQSLKRASESACASASVSVIVSASVSMSCHCRRELCIYTRLIRRLSSSSSSLLAWNPSSPIGNLHHQQFRSRAHPQNIPRLRPRGGHPRRGAVKGF